MFALHLLVENRSLREPKGEAGIADLLHRTMADVAETATDAPTSPLERIGATLKVTDSAWIPYDDYYTTPLYSFVRLECVDEYYREALDLLTAMLTEPHDNADAIADAHKDMMSAIQRAAANPADVSRARLRELLYPDHPLSMPVMGDALTLNSITPPKLAEFASAYLAPGGMILSVVGNVPRDEAMEAVRATLGRLPAKAVDATTVPPIPLTTESARSEIDGDGKQSSIRMGRVVDVDPGDRWALLVAIQIASEHMQQDLRETRGLAYSLGIGVDFEGTRAAITASMGTRPENLEEAEAGVRSYLTRGGLHASDDEVEKAVNGYLSRMRMRRITSMGRAFNLGVDLFLEGGIDYAAREAAGMASVTPDDVDRVATRYLVDAPMVTVIAR
jgi:predicted Zn-dependent peptidase